MPNPLPLCIFIPLPLTLSLYLSFPLFFLQKVTVCLSIFVCFNMNLKLPNPIPLCITTPIPSPTHKHSSLGWCCVRTLMYLCTRRPMYYLACEWIASLPGPPPFSLSPSILCAAFPKEKKGRESVKVSKMVRQNLHKIEIPWSAFECVYVYSCVCEWNKGHTLNTFVCVFICVCVHMYVYVCVSVSVCVHVCILKFYVCVYLNICLYVCLFLSAFSS